MGMSDDDSSFTGSDRAKAECRAPEPELPDLLQRRWDSITAMWGVRNDLYDIFQEALRAIKHPAALSDTDRRYARNPTARKCKCGLHEVPAGIDGVSWYHQLHQRFYCYVELPNSRCWCGLLWSEHVTGHDETAKPPEHTTPALDKAQAVKSVNTDRDEQQ